MEFASFMVFFVIACTLSAVLLGISSLLGQKRKIAREMDIYESGVNPVGSATRQYDIKFYLTAILFLLFDVEIVFLLPWALAYKDSSNHDFMIVGFIFFMAIMLVGYIFVINSKALKWEK
ncbi:MAG: NADH-quinone oxidoreductase subunit A [Bacteriovorax sp.]|nr:NADH-quinone oxidoreductase subunit A [Bacteriovorax sp.]